MPETLEEITITLGVKAPRDFVVGLLSLKQMRSVAPDLAKFMEAYKGRLDCTESFDLITSAIFVSIREKAPEVSRAMLDDMDISIAQLVKASDLLLEFSGVWKRGVASGEAQPGPKETTPSTSTPSIPK